jgi:translation initiation factor 5A
LASEKRQSEIKDLKDGSFVLIDDVPCQVEGIQISKPGKHGSAKARLSAKGIFDSQKRIIVKPAGSNVDVPIIEKKSMQVIALIGENVQLMDLEDYSTQEVRVPDTLKGQLSEGEEVLVWRFGPHILIKGKKG